MLITKNGLWKVPSTYIVMPVNSWRSTWKHAKFQRHHISDYKYPCVGGRNAFYCYQTSPRPAISTLHMQKEIEKLILTTDYLIRKRYAQHYDAMAALIATHHVWGGCHPSLRPAERCVANHIP